MANVLQVAGIVAIAAGVGVIFWPAGSDLRRGWRCPFWPGFGA
jgi:hypothetical protein